MTEGEMLLGRIDERTAAMVEDVKEIKTDVKAIAVKQEGQEKRLTVLETEHKARMECPPQGQGISRKALVATAGGSGLAGAAMTLIVELLKGVKI